MGVSSWLPVGSSDGRPCPWIGFTRLSPGRHWPCAL